MLTGLRQAELCALGWDCVEIDKPPFLLRVIGQAQRQWNRDGATRPREPTKTKRNRAQSLHENAVAILRVQRAEMKRRGWYRSDGPIFPGVGGAWRTSGRVLLPHKMKQFAKEAGFPHWEQWVVHSLRHSFATLEVKSSGDLKRTQARTGHSSVKQLESYLHATGAFLGNTAIPHLPIRLDPVRTLSDGTQVGQVDSEGDVSADPWGIERVPGAPDTTLVTHDAAASFDAERRDNAREVRAASEKKFSDIALVWVQNPERTNSGIPKAVAMAIHRNYCQAYTRELRASKDKAKARRAAMLKSRACKGAWARAVAIAERKLSCLAEYLRGNARASANQAKDTQ
jgi:hypothetical protein